MTAVVLNGIELRTIGDGAPRFVFFHGCPTTVDVMDDIAAQLPGASVCVSSPGYGKSPAMPGPMRLDALHQRLEDALVLAGAVDAWLVGFSAGAYHALALAGRPALRVRGVTTLGGLLALGDDERAGFRQLADALEAGADLRPIAGPRFLSEKFRALHPERVADVERWLTATPRENLVAELRGFADAPDLTERVHTLSIPVVARVGAVDLASPVPKSEAIARAARNGRLEVVEGAGHALPYEDQDGVVRSLSGSSAGGV